MQSLCNVKPRLRLARYSSHGCGCYICSRRPPAIVSDSWISRWTLGQTPNQPLSNHTVSSLAINVFSSSILLPKTSFPVPISRWRSSWVLWVHGELIA